MTLFANLPAAVSDHHADSAERHELRRQALFLTRSHVKASQHFAIEIRRASDLNHHVVGIRCRSHPCKGGELTLGDGTERDSHDAQVQKEAFPRQDSNLLSFSPQKVPRKHAGEKPTSKHTYVETIKCMLLMTLPNILEWAMSEDILDRDSEEGPRKRVRQACLNCR